MNLAFRTLLIIPFIALLAVATPASAQQNWRQVAVPAYDSEDFAQALRQYLEIPRADEFLAAAQVLETSLQKCPQRDLPATRQAWRRAVLAWAILNSPPPAWLVEKRSAREIDFLPTRPARITAAVSALAAAPDETSRAAVLATAGSAAKGLPALEWLLWSAPDDAAHCAYAARLGSEIAATATALSTALHAPGDLDEAAAKTVLNDALNQWLGAVAQLHMQWIVRPLGEATSHHAAPAFPRALADADSQGAASRDERRQRWQALRALASTPADAVLPAPTFKPTLRGTVTLENLLRSKGRNPLADRLLKALQAVDLALPKTAMRNETAALERSARALAALERLVQTEITPVLGVQLGFSDADGD